MTRVVVELRSRMPFPTPMVAVPAFEDGRQDNHTDRMDGLLGGAIARGRASGEITGKRGSVTVITNDQAAGQQDPPLAAERVAVIGLGNRSELNMETVKAFAALAASKARELRLSAFALHP